MSDEAQAALREIDNAVDGGADQASPLLFKVERLRSRAERAEKERDALAEALRELVKYVKDGPDVPGWGGESRATVLDPANAALAQTGGENES